MRNETRVGKAARRVGRAENDEKIGLGTHGGSGLQKDSLPEDQSEDVASH